ncbi:MAG: hypothetical protein EPGJADBJ_01092 [Saprospiraceae bacterium]|nr:hypothetical protein [Saprospiraceae bacterium]
MFDLNNIKIIKNDEEHGRRNYSFVGIQRSRQDDEQLEFWLPLGFKDFDEGDFDQVKGFFFKMYRTFKTYLQKKQEELNEEDITIDRDGIIENENGFSFINENKEQSVFYGKLNSIEKIIAGYDELRISALEKKQVRSHEIDYSKLHRYLHQAIYLEDDVIYLDEMNIAKNVIVKSSPPILQLFCFIYAEIKAELEEVETITIKAIELADQFKEEHLQPDSKLFGEKTFAETVDILRAKLDEIDIETTYKDEDYWHFYEAIEAFLYGERHEDNDGIYWGFSSFYDVWEDMCQTYAINETKYRGRVIYADVDGTLIANELYKDFLNPFDLRINNLQVVRKLKPDLVLEPIAKSISNIFSSKQIIKYQKRAHSIVFLDYPNLRNSYPKIFYAYERYVQIEENYLQPGRKYFFMYENDFRQFLKVANEELEDLYSEAPYQIIDYKYMRISDYETYSPFYIDEKGENKVKEDIHKQLVYEWTVQQNWSAKTQSEFWIPFFSSDPSVLEQVEVINNPYFNKSQIKVVKINFKTLQEFYLKQSLA